ncbi:MAG: hypothetical protein WCJ39_00165 [bacterium]
MQKLANIRLNDSEEKKLGAQLENIIQFLGQLNNLPARVHQDIKPEHTLRTRSGCRQGMDSKKLLANVQHPIINNSIEIKSVLS